MDWPSRGKARDAMDNIDCCLAGPPMSDGSSDLEDLSDVGEFEVVVQFGTRPDLPNFESAMLLIDRCCLRGE